MANSHIPKFGNWENDDIPYSAYFDNARKDNLIGNVRMNQNDAEENPEAFMTMMQRRGSSRSLEGYNTSHDHNLHASVLREAAVGQPPHRLMKSTSMIEKSHHADEHTRINMNDPEENTKAFMTMMQRRRSSSSLEGYNASHDHNLHTLVLQAAPVGRPPHRLIKSTSTTKKSRHAGKLTRINSNDLEENPEAFTTMMRRRGSSRSPKGYNASHDHNLHASALQAAAVGQPSHCLVKSTSTIEKSRHADKHTRHRERRSHHKNSTTSANSSSINHKSSAPESGSEPRTSFDYSFLSPPNQGRYIRSDDHYKKKSATTSSGSRGSDSFSSASEQAGNRRHRRSTSYHSSDHQQQHHRAASIPRFGSWDVNDRRSGEGFTVIFDKMKEEKQSNAAANSKVPSRTMSPPRQPSTNRHKDQRNQPGIISSCISKIYCCCMSSSGSK